jgi:hypothetical protein
MPKLQRRKPKTLSRWYEWSYDHLIPWCADANKLNDITRQRHTKLPDSGGLPVVGTQVLCHCNVHSENPNAPQFLFPLRSLLRPYTREGQATLLMTQDHTETMARHAC